MTYPQAIVAGAALIAAAILGDARFPTAQAQIDPTHGFEGDFAAGQHLWWVEAGHKINRVYLCVEGTPGPACSHTDVPK